MVPSCKVCCKLELVAFSVRPLEVLGSYNREKVVDSRFRPVGEQDKFVFKPACSVKGQIMQVAEG